MALNLNLREQLVQLVTGELPEAARARADDEEKQLSREEEAKRVKDWTEEIQLAKRYVKDWHEDAGDAVNAYLDDPERGNLALRRNKLNLFHSNITTIQGIMFAKMPKVEADRRFADPADDVARVASEMVTRILQNDMNDPDDKYVGVLKHALQDRLIAGLGAARVRYCIEEEGEGDTAVKTDEWCDMEYCHWRDLLWSPARTYADLRWKAYRVYLTKAEVLARFGEEHAKHVPYQSRGPSLDPETDHTDQFVANDRAAQAEVWEIWDNNTKCVYWYVEGYHKFLDKKQDPTKFDGFWSDAPWMMANITTRKYLPRPDYMLSKDLYDEINELEHRLAMLTKACKVVGVYPASAEEVQRLLTEGLENRLIPVENWAMFVDKGGLKGQIDYFPVKDIVEAIAVLVQQQQLRIQQLYQVTGMSDILRGDTNPNETLGAQKLKAQFASTRIRSLQDEFASFASELLNKKVQLIRRLYDPERIKKLSNVMNTPDAALADQAIALIKDTAQFNCRVKVEAESMAQIDYESLKQERGEYLMSVSNFLGQSTPLLQALPAAGPFLLELLKFSLAGYKSANTMESVVDQAIASLVAAEQQKAAQPPQPSPEEKAEQIRVQGQMQIEQAKAQASQASDAAKAQMEMQKLQQEMALKQQELAGEMERDREKHKLEMAKLVMEIRKLQAELEFKREEQALKIQGQQAEMTMDIQHAEQEHALDMEVAAAREDREASKGEGE